jgi:hypothetical protein
VGVRIKRTGGEEKGLRGLVRRSRNENEHVRRSKDEEDR